MSNSKLFNSVILSCFFISFASCTSPTTRKCSAQQARALLLFKESLFSINDTSSRRICEDSFPPDPKLMNWNINSDCCNWGGVTCENSTGDIIYLHLRCGMLQGTIHANSTLFSLQSLEELDLSKNNFTGQIPSEISHLTKLSFLDLSYNSGIDLPPYILNNLLLNSTLLTYLWLAEVNLGFVLPTYLNISSSLKSLDLTSTGLQGKVPDNIFNLKYLEELILPGNSNLTGPMPIVNTSTSINLRWLDLSFTNLSGRDSFSIGISSLAIPEFSQIVVDGIPTGIHGQP
ncbi:leucine-rich repeat-containing protein [Tanacetum coccineum]|uniref:Leucine-rich repeat-containing protein n=1 Tax=Tanacetum coccineum TaxID=301880 RepID=A0ABQ5GF65_9ASTR